MDNRALGVIDASFSGSRLVLDGSDTNAGLLEATNGAELQINNNVTNAASGIIEAAANSEVMLESGTVISGGTLKTDNTGLVVVVAAGSGSTTTLDGSNAVIPTNTMITISGELLVNGDLSLQGTINNTGTISLLPADLTVLAAGSRTNVTLEGKGTIVLSGDITGKAFDPTVVKLVNVNNDISGAGTIGGGNMRSSIRLAVLLMPMGPTISLSSTPD